MDCPVAVSLVKGRISAVWQWQVGHLLVVGLSKQLLISDNSNLPIKDVQFGNCFSGLKVLLHIAVSYSCPLNVQPATPLDFFYPILVPSKSCWLPPGCCLQFPTPLSHHKCFKLHFSSLSIRKEGRNRSLLLLEHCLTSSSHCLLRSPYLKERTRTRAKQNDVYT